MRLLPRPVPPPEETGDTFEENAIGKAEYYGGFTDGYLFADDSGLGGRRARRRAGRALGALCRSAKQRTPTTMRCCCSGCRASRTGRARFVCVIALVKDGKLVRTFRGAVEGRILEAPRGSGGFGYDPLFYYEPFGCTFGEAPIGDKMLVSHRAQALEAMFTLPPRYLCQRRKPIIVFASMILPV